MGDDLSTHYKRKQRNFRLTFDNEAGKAVLGDLRTFCFVTKPIFGNESDGMAMALEAARRAGRKETFDRIMTFLKVDYEDIYTTYEDDYD